MLRALAVTKQGKGSLVIENSFILLGLFLRISTLRCYTTYETEQDLQNLQKNLFTA